MLNLIKVALAASLICSVAACAPAAEKIETASAAKTIETPSKTFEPVATVKPGANVSMTSALPKFMTSGTFQTVQLRFDEAYTDGTMTVTIEPSAGLRLFGGTASKTFNLAVPGTHLWDLDVKSDTDGVYFLNVFANAQGEARSFSVRLDMGTTTQKMFDEAMPADGELSEGGKIRVMEAEETIK